jgi:ribosomal-protein-alanine N-acetyltransferase
MILRETERLIVRDHRASDLPGLTALMTSSEEMRFLPELLCPDGDAARENLVTSIAEQERVDREKFFFAIEEKLSGRYVGEIGFTLVERRPAGARADLGYFLLSEFRGKGYATEAGRSVVAFAFAEAGVWKLQTGCLKENAASERVMRKLGFRKEGELRLHQWHEGAWKDRLVYGLLATDLQ